MIVIARHKIWVSIKKEEATNRLCDGGLGLLHLPIPLDSTKGSEGKEVYLDDERPRRMGLVRFDTSTQLTEKHSDSKYEELFVGDFARTIGEPSPYDELCSDHDPEDHLTLPWSETSVSVYMSIVSYISYNVKYFYVVNKIIKQIKS